MIIITNSSFSQNQAYVDDPVVNEIVRESLQEDLRLQLDSARDPRSPYAIKGSPSGSRRALYDSARSSAARRPSSGKHASQRSDRSKHEGEAAMVEEGGDVLDRHKGCFTAARPFQPRVLRKNVPSKLSQFRYYNRPKPAAGRRASEPGLQLANGETEPVWSGEQADGRREVAGDEADSYQVEWLKQQAKRSQVS